MTLEYKIALALILDFLFGDPKWMPHPVRLIGWMIAKIEEPVRKAFKNDRAAGLFAAPAVILTASVVVWGLIAAAGRISQVAQDLVSIFFLYSAFAARDLADHSRAVHAALQGSDLEEARRRVAEIVGRDTKDLSEKEVVRAAVESVAENTVDGVVAPLFFATLGGPVGAIAYKAASTLDSMIGYQNEQYIDFGKTAARIDDGANWIPARLAMPIIVCAAAILGLRSQAAWRIALRDGRKHLSPNAGISEAAFAGALGIRLGGIMKRKGKALHLPELGDPDFTLARDHILVANRLMFATSLLAAFVFLLARSCIAALF